MPGILPALFILFNVLLRLAGISRPLLGNFAVYQIAQAMMATFFMQENFTTLLYPKVNFVINDKPSLMILYYPLSSLIAAVSASLTGGHLDLWGRLQAVIFFGLAAFYLYRLVHALMGRESAFWSLVFFCFSPLTIIYGQSFQNEMAAVFFSVFFFYQLRLFLIKSNLFCFFSASLALAAVLITRPSALYILIPAVYLSISLRQAGEKSRLGGSIAKVLGIAATGSILPGFWYFHGWTVSSSADNIYSTLFAQFESRSSFLNPLALNTEYYGRLLDILSGVALTPLGLTFLILGLIYAVLDFRSAGFFLVWVLSFSLSSLAIARKLIDHNLYLLHLVIAAAPLMGMAFERTLSHLNPGSKRNIAAGSFMLIFLLVSMRYAYHPAFVTPARSENTLRVAEQIKNSTPPDAKIISASPDSMSLLYYGERLGWNFFYQDNRAVPSSWKTKRFSGLSPEAQEARNKAYEHSVPWLEYLRGQGADYFFASEPSEFLNDTEFARYVEKHYRKISHPETDFVAFDLHETA